MHDLWGFVGGYWWLVFPLMGIMGGVGRAWERSARGRHARRLEILHAKAEVKAAQAAARGRRPMSASGPLASPLPAPAPVEDPTATQLERLFAAHDAVTARWLEYELDVAKLIAFPAMSDGRQPLTAAFLRAKKVADGLRPASAKARLTREQLTEYRDAVTDYEVAFDVAERDARRLKDTSFTEPERRRLDKAKQLLTVAIDEAATPAERQVAYRRVREELDGLISLSDGAIEVLEKKVALELTTGPTPTVDAAAPTPRTGAGGTAAAAGSGAPAAPAGTPAASSGVSAAPPSRDPTTAPDPQAGKPRPASPQPAPAPMPPREPKAAQWPVPARSANTAPGRIIRPKQHP